MISYSPTTGEHRHHRVLRGAGRRRAGRPGIGGDAGRQQGVLRQRRPVPGRPDGDHRQRLRGRHHGAADRRHGVRQRRGRRQRQRDDPRPGARAGHHRARRPRRPCSPPPATTPTAPRRPPRSRCSRPTSPSPPSRGSVRNVRKDKVTFSFSGFVAGQAHLRLLPPQEGRGQGQVRPGQGPVRDAQGEGAPVPGRPPERRTLQGHVRELEQVRQERVPPRHGDAEHPALLALRRPGGGPAVEHRRPACTSCRPAHSGGLAFGARAHPHRRHRGEPHRRARRARTGR